MKKPGMRTPRCDAIARSIMLGSIADIGEAAEEHRCLQKSPMRITPSGPPSDAGRMPANSKNTR